MKLIDTHCHLADRKLMQDAAAVLNRAGDAGVAGVICAAGDLREAEKAVQLARRFENVFCMAGVHPHEAKSAPPTYIQQIEQLLAETKCVALGEIGLDYHYDFSPRDVQRRVFAEQLALTGRVAVPVVIHTREAFKDTMSILSESGVEGSRVIFHSFTGGPIEAREVLDFGATLSFSGIATFKRTDDIRGAAVLAPDDRIRAAAVLAPDDRILIETDSPYLSPEPVRKMKINEPANVAHVARSLAELRRVDPETFAAQTTANAIRVFHLDIG